MDLFSCGCTNSSSNALCFGKGLQKGFSDGSNIILDTCLEKPFPPVELGQRSPLSDQHFGMLLQNIISVAVVGCFFSYLQSFWVDMSNMISRSVNQDCIDQFGIIRYTRLLCSNIS